MIPRPIPVSLMTKSSRDDQESSVGISGTNMMMPVYPGAPWLPKYKGPGEGMKYPEWKDDPSVTDKNNHPVLSILASIPIKKIFFPGFPGFE